MARMPDSATARAVLITGCSTGIGRATALHLLDRGWTVYATARRPETLDELAATGAKVLALDVTDARSRQAAVDAVIEAEGAVGALVNNAGFGLEGPAETTPLEEVRGQFDTNFFGAVALAQLVLPGMREQGWGRIVNVSSMGGRITLPGGAFYHASKFALEAWSDVLRWEVGGFGIGVTIIEPGIIHTEFGATATARLEDLGGGPGDPYADFTRSIHGALDNAYGGTLSRLGSSPEAVAAAIEKALAARRPKPRIVVGRDARAMLLLHRLVPTRVYDAALTTQYKRPKR